MVDLNRDVARGEDRGCYAYAEVECAQGGDAVLQIGSDDGVVCWLNGKEVHRNIVPRPYAADQDQAKVQLKAGKNTLLLKILQGAGDWAFGVRITDPEGTPFVITQEAPGVFTADPGEEEQVDAKRHILYYTLTTGFRHDIIPYSKGVLRDVGREGGAFRVTVTEDASKITPEYLAQFDAVVLNTTGQPFPTPQAKQAFLDFVRGGKGVVGVHSATDTHYDWPEFGEMLGGWFDGHPWNQVVGFKIDDPKHPACRMIPDDWKVPDEIYQFRNWDRAKCHMLLTIDNATVDVNKQGVKRADKDFAVAWTKEYGKGKVFYTSLGHTRQVWDSPIFRQHLRQGILWTMGDAE
jgi:type 1 glutamine amidotransferase